jgi:hypothetical protein
MSWGCTRDEIWGAVVRWRAGLPPGVRLLMHVTILPGLVACVSVDIDGSPHDLDPPRVPVWPHARPPMLPTPADTP